MRRRTARSEGLTRLILAIFKANGDLLAAGDRLVAPLGLTSARWQVLGAIAMAASAQPVAGLARSMGLTRQAVQRIANELAAEGFVTFEPNPHHQRAKLVLLTNKGRSAYGAAIRSQSPWVKALAEGLTTGELATATRVLELITRRLDRNH
jgi:DNA-binding MarR family transcriptional regulator